AEEFMLWVGNLVINKCGTAESPNLRNQVFEGLNFLSIKCKSWSGTWWKWFVHIPYLSCASRQSDRVSQSVEVGPIGARDQCPQCLVVVVLVVQVLGPVLMEGRGQRYPELAPEFSVCGFHRFEASEIIDQDPASLIAQPVHLGAKMYLLEDPGRLWS